MANKLSYGYKTEHGVFFDKKEDVLNTINGLNLRGYLKWHSNYMLNLHAKNEKTLYYTSRNYDSKAKKHSDFICFNVDVDIQKSQKLGTVQGGKDFIHNIEKKFLPGLFIEPSTKLEGQHGYGILDCRRLSNEQVNELLNKLEKVLRAYAKEINADIEIVEIKGHCPVITWEQGVATDINMGRLAKIPRTMNQREAEFLNIQNHVLKYWQINDWYNALPEPEQKQIVKQKSSSLGISIFDFDKTESTKEGGGLFTLAAQILGNEVLECGKDRNVTAEDVAIFLMLFHFFSTNKQSLETGAMPYIRFKHLWEALYKAGDVNRGFCNKRWKAIRDLLTARKFIDWEDESYEPPVGEGEDKVKGKACKWLANEVLIELVEDVYSGINSVSSNRENRIASRVGSDTKTSEPLEGNSTSDPETRPAIVYSLARIEVYNQKMAEKSQKQFEKMIEYGLAS
jgi:hypothetical protein